MTDADMPAPDTKADLKPDPKSDNTQDIIAAIRRIMAAEVAMLEDDPDMQIVSKEAQTRIQAALARLTGNSDTPPTLLEALILEKLEPLMADRINLNLPPLVERLMREEIRALLERSQTRISIGEPSLAET